MIQSSSSSFLRTGNDLNKDNKGDTLQADLVCTFLHESHCSVTNSMLGCLLFAPGSHVFTHLSLRADSKDRLVTVRYLGAAHIPLYLNLCFLGIIGLSNIGQGYTILTLEPKLEHMEAVVLPV